jgi:hypothetical protein
MSRPPTHRRPTAPGPDRPPTTEELLRRALAAEADAVEVAPDALQVIRARIQRRRAHWWRPRRSGWGALLAFGGGAVAAAAVVAVLLGLTGVLPSRPVSPGGRPTRQPASPLAVANLPVYFVGATVAGPRLYREYWKLPTGAGTVEERTSAALGAVLGGVAPADAEYRSPWPAGAELGPVSIGADTVQVDIDRASTNPGVDEATAVAAVQQLVWTATAVSGATGVLLLVDGRPANDLWGLVGVGSVLHRDPAASTLAPIWIIDPQSGTTVGGTFTVRLAGIVAGTRTGAAASVGLVVRDPTGATVWRRQVALSAAAPAQGTATLSVTLPAGRYSIEGYRLGANGAELDPDRHSITVD